MYRLLLLTVLTIASSCLSRPLPAGERLRTINIDNIEACWDSTLDVYIETISKEPCTLALNAKGRAELIRTEKAIELNDGNRVFDNIFDNKAPPLIVAESKENKEVKEITAETNPTTILPPSIPAFSATVAEEQMLAELNNFRARCNPPLPPLIISPYIMSFARRHAYDMASRNSMYHSNFGQENVAAGYGSANAAMNGWINSPGHNANMRTRNTEVGLSVAQSRNGTYYWVQQFASGTTGRPIVSAARNVVTAPARFVSNNMPMRRGFFGRFRH